MMGGRAGYRFARATCSAPGSLPGRIVNVTLADMGMTTDDGRYRPVGCTHAAAGLAGHAPPPGTISRGRLEPGVAHPRTRHPPARRRRRAPASGCPVSRRQGRRDRQPGRGLPTAAPAGQATASRAGTVGWTTLTLPPGRYELDLQPRQPLRRRDAPRSSSSRERASSRTAPGTATGGARSARPGCASPRRREGPDSVDCRSLAEAAAGPLPFALRGFPTGTPQWAARMIVAQLGRKLATNP